MGRHAKHPSGPTRSMRVRASPAFFDWLQACQETWGLSQADTLERVKVEMERLHTRHPPGDAVEVGLPAGVTSEGQLVTGVVPVDVPGDDTEGFARS